MVLKQIALFTLSKPKNNKSTVKFANTADELTFSFLFYLARGFAILGPVVSFKIVSQSESFSKFLNATADKI